MPNTHATPPLVGERALEFQKLVEPGTSRECWKWRGTKDRYGRFYADGRMHAAHRIALALATDSTIPADLDVLHDCDNKLCVNPSHLRVGTNQENAMDWSRSLLAKRGGACKHGHTGAWHVIHRKLECHECELERKRRRQRRITEARLRRSPLLEARACRRCESTFEVDLNIWNQSVKVNCSRKCMRLAVDDRNEERRRAETAGRRAVGAQT